MPRTECAVSDQGGFTLLEIAAAATLLVVGVLSLAATFLSTSRLYEDNRDTRIVATALRNVVETLRGEDFLTLTQNYGSGTANPQFWVGDDGVVSFVDPGDAHISGTILFFADESAIPSEFADLTGGFDLNADGVITSGAITDYEVLPTRITFAISNDLSGSRSRQVDLVLTFKQSW